MHNVNSKDGTLISYDEVGDGQLIVLVGGAFQTRHDPMMQELSGLLSKDFKVVSYDRRGRGDSGDTKPYSVERETEDIEAIIDELGAPAYLFGMSSGSVLALNTASHLKNKVTKVAVYEAPFIMDDSRPPLPADYLDHLKKMIAENRRGDAVELFMIHAAGVPKEYVTGMRSQPFWSAMEAVAPTLIYDASLMGNNMSGKPLDVESTQTWSEITAPVLVLDGGASPTQMRTAAEALAKVLHNNRRQTLEGQSHDVAPSVLTPVLREFYK